MMLSQPKSSLTESERFVKSIFERVIQHVAKGDETATDFIFVGQTDDQSRLAVRTVIVAGDTIELCVTVLIR